MFIAFKYFLNVFKLYVCVCVFVCVYVCLCVCVNVTDFVSFFIKIGLLVCNRRSLLIEYNEKFEVKLCGI